MQRLKTSSNCACLHFVLRSRNYTFTAFRLSPSVWVFNFVAFPRARASWIPRAGLVSLANQSCCMNTWWPINACASERCVGWYITLAGVRPAHRWTCCWWRSQYLMIKLLEKAFTRLPGLPYPVHFTSRCYLRAREIPYAFRPDSRRYLQRFLGNCFSVG